jgi:hypothetical protein
MCAVPISAGGNAEWGIRSPGSRLVLSWLHSHCLHTNPYGFDEQLGAMHVSCIVRL